MWYGESNYRELIRAQNARSNGLAGTRPRSEHPFFFGYGSIPGTVIYEDVMPPVIPRSEWADRVAEIDAGQAWPTDRITWKARSQSSTRYCWANGPCTAAEIQAVMQGLPFVQWSAASVAAPITNYRNVGGWGADAVEHLLKFGAAAEALWPNAAISRQYDTAESRADRENRKVLEWIDVPANNFDALATCLLLGFACAVGYDWWGHEVVATRLVKNGSSWGVEIRNSWGEWGTTNRHGVYGFSVLSESKGTPDDCQAVRQVTSAAAIPGNGGVA
jgi:hypothetical protein